MATKPPTRKSHPKHQLAKFSINIPAPFFDSTSLWGLQVQGKTLFGPVEQEIQGKIMEFQGISQGLMGLNGSFMGFNGGLMGFNGGLMGFNGGLMGFNGGLLEVSWDLMEV